MSVRPSTWDNPAARSHLRDRVALVSGGVRVTAEPLIKESANGLLQSIRIDGATPENVVVRTADGVALPVESEPIAGGVRVLVPEVDRPTPLRIEPLGVSIELTPQRHWTVHVIHHSHYDIGYTDQQGRVRTEQIAYLDDVLHLVKETDDWPDDAKFRWNVEALWAFDQWSANRPRRQVEEFIQRVREGRIEFSAMPFNLHTETCSTDELHELLRLSKVVREKYGVDIRTAMQTDVPGAVSGLVDALAANGVQYLSVAHNWAGLSVPHLLGGQDVPRLFRWKSPSGASLLVWMADTPHGMAYMEGPLLGFHESYAVVDDQLPAYLNAMARFGYPYDGDMFGWQVPDAPLHRTPYPWDVLHLRVNGRFADNAPPRRLVAQIVRDWNAKWAYPKLRMSTNEDFFRDAERREGIPTFVGDWNDSWAIGVGSAARAMQISRRGQGQLADAQTIETIASLVDGDEVDPADAERTYLAAALFDEHTWGASNAWRHGDAAFDSGEEQWHWKYAQGLLAHDDARMLLDRASVRLAESAGTADGALASFHVVNTTSWARTDVVRAFLPESRVPVETPVAVRDARTGKSLPVAVSPQLNPNHRDAGRFLLIEVADVPALGKVRVDVVPAETQAEPQPAEGTVLENDFLRVEIDLSTATIASIVEKRTGREIVRPDAATGFNGYIYDTYTSSGGFNHASSKFQATDRLELLGGREHSRPAALINRRRTAVAEEITYESTVPGARWLRTTVSLPHGVARVDIANRLAKDPTMTKESAFFAFPFNVDDPTVRIDVTGGVVGTGLPVVPGSAEHLRSMRRWVSVEDAGGAMALATPDVPLVQIGQITLPYAPFPPTLVEDEPATVFSWVHNNIWDTNFPSEQGFEATFRYSVAPGPGPGPVLGMRTAAATSHPL
ncbi:MAG TPA: glycoside hydrolase family 38 C-terminal domain-containing protein, partial [Mycobacteriales bacterium]|nr:glycoside hydrolase family 38 C-terminal domain-containing protein [Mycobacteriales bacterium]